uniref:Glutathione S-transferase kappa n=2 Tax=Petromyzon marinus TaxID=7757 RepID=S4RZZ3_PETMA
ITMSRRLVEIFYDVVSPYSWLGFEILCRYRSVWNIDVRLRPAFLGGVMAASGNKPPGLVPNKARYMAKDLERLRDYFQLPIALPRNPAEAMFQKGSLAAQRFLTAVDMECPAQLEEASRQLWMRIWSRDEDITLPESIAAAAARAGLQEELIQKLLAMATSQPVKDRLKSTTEDLMQHAAFGMPAIVAHVNGKQHLYFGSDRFELLAHLLGEKWYGPLPSQAKL